MKRGSRKIWLPPSLRMARQAIQSELTALLAEVSKADMFKMLAGCFSSLLANVLKLDIQGSTFFEGCLAANGAIHCLDDFQKGNLAWITADLVAAIWSLDGRKNPGGNQGLQYLQKESFWNALCLSHMVGSYRSFRLLGCHVNKGLNGVARCASQLHNTFGLPLWCPSSIKPHSRTTRSGLPSRLHGIQVDISDILRFPMNLKSEA